MNTKRHLTRALSILGLSLILPASAQEDMSRSAWKAKPYPELPDDVTRKSVVIWSEGTRMAGDVYAPKNSSADTKLPAIVFVHGTGGVKKMEWSIKIAVESARRGYVFLNFDYRGWGESDSRLMRQEDLPKPDNDGNVNVQARASLADGLRRPSHRHPQRAELVDDLPFSPTKNLLAVGSNLVRDWTREIVIITSLIGFAARPCGMDNHPLF